ncbi:hypothetical protein IV203_003726 [Nitzschia inconspicua]|uniref:Uncharacterized protein n=1 Tax=Nitzschia inconspicua TaxID=303405 RepID=A0A9K3PNV6_9STRA|nr:hypothetical protein IV203_003726 [Nitzschia inconspicua]
MASQISVNNVRHIPVHHDDQLPINCLASPSYFDDTSRPLLIIIPGKGALRAGILCTKQLVLSGMQVGSAAFLIQKATQYHNMAVLTGQERRSKHTEHHSPVSISSIGPLPVYSQHCYTSIGYFCQLQRPEIGRYDPERYPLATSVWDHPHCMGRNDGTQFILLDRHIIWGFFLGHLEGGLDGDD